EICAASIKKLLGYCPQIENNGHAINAGASKTTTPQSGAHRAGSGSSPIVDVVVRPPERSPFERCLEDWKLMLRCIEAVADGEPAPEPDAGTPEIPAITITDLASFAPAPARITGEPDNLGVAGLPTNFTADATTHTRD